MKRKYPNGDDSGILVGDIDFLNSPGKFSFAFDYWDAEEMLHHEQMELYVASPKLDTKNDLQQIMALVNQEYENYVFDYLTLTFSSFVFNVLRKTTISFGTVSLRVLWRITSRMLGL